MKTLIPSAKEVPTYVIDGRKAVAWPDFVNSINAFIPNSEWQGNSLDALDDILYGGYGAPDRFIVVWTASEASRKALGYEATRDYYKRLPDFDQLYEAGLITTLFDMVVGIFRGHENIELRLE
jgi:RNAse (barnase) inhibitor barstar